MMIYSKACAVLAATAFLVSAADNEPGGHSTTIRKGGGTSPPTTSNHGLFVGPAIQSSSSAALRRGTAATAAVIQDRELKPDDLDKEKEKVIKIENEMADLKEKMDALLAGMRQGTNLDDLRAFANAVAGMKKNELKAYLISAEGKVLFSGNTSPEDMDKLSKKITALVEKEAKLKKDLLKQRLKLFDKIEARLADVKEEIGKVVEKLELEANDVQALRDLLAGEDLVGKEQIEARLREMQNNNGSFGDAKINYLMDLFALIEEEAELEEDLFEQIPKLLDNINARLEDLQLEINQLSEDLDLDAEDVASLRALFEEGREPTKDEIEAIFPSGPSFKDLKDLIALIEEEAELELRKRILEGMLRVITSTPSPCPAGETLLCFEESGDGRVFSQLCVQIADNVQIGNSVNSKEVAALGCCSTDHGILTAMFASTGVFELVGQNPEGCPAFSSIRGSDLDGEFECKTGTAEQVTTWCNEDGKNRNCCQEGKGFFYEDLYPGCDQWLLSSNGAQSRFETEMADPDAEVTVCEGSCNGAFACWGMPEGTFVAPGSCFEVGSCLGIARGATAERKSVVIGSSSCLNTYSCYEIGILEATSVSIGANSCTEILSCASVGAEFATSVTIESNACKTAENQCSGWDINTQLYFGSSLLEGDVVCTAGDVDEDTCESKEVTLPV